MTQLISAAETAQQLGISTKTLDNWRSTGKSELEFVKIGWLVKYKQGTLIGLLITIRLITQEK